MCLFECTSCGHRYVDGLKLSQAWFDNYYLTQYQTDDKPYSDARLDSLADYIVDNIPVISFTDIGGMDFELANRINKYREVSCRPVGIGFERLMDFGVILSHTLEHVYDINELFSRITTEWLIIEVPIHLGYQDPKAYDLHWQHINKFRPIDLERLCTRKGFEIVESKQIADYREYQVWRIVGRKNGAA